MDRFLKLVKNNKYLLFLLYWPVYLLAFFTIDRIEAEHFIITCAFDNLIPFNEYFVIAYALWFFWFPGWTFFFLWHALKPYLINEGILRIKASSGLYGQAELARKDFVKLCTVMFTSMTLSLITYVVWPNAVDLREPIEGTNICATAVGLIRAADTPYGVCPSIHVATIAAEAYVIAGSRLKRLTPSIKAAAFAVTLLISYSTMAIKQHSIIDVIAGALLAAVLYVLYEIAAGLRH